MGFLGFLLILFSVTAGAQGLPYTRPTLELHLAQTLIEVRQIMDKIHEDLGDLQSPKDLHLASVCESYDPIRNKYNLSYEPLTHTLHFQGLSSYGKSHHSPLLTHEYAHVIFRANIALLEAPEINDDLSQSILLGDLVGLSFLEPAPDQCLHTPTAEGDDLYKQLLKNDYFTFHAMKLGAYDELFADILAALYEGRPNAMFEALGGDQVNWQEKYSLSLPKGYRGRDFSYEVPLEGWRSDKPTLAFYDFLGTPSDFYNVLDPLRKPLWDQYLKHLKRQQYAPFIKAYIRATGIEFRYIQDHQIWDLPIQDMNKRFWGHLQKELARENIYSK